MSAWPSSLPQKMLQGSYNEQRVPSTIRSQVEVGPAKMRRRYTSDVTQVRGEVLLTTAQVATLETFYVTTLEAGSLSFDWTQQRTTAAAEYRFVSAPGYSEAAPGYWLASLDLEMLP